MVSLHLTTKLIWRGLAVEYTTMQGVPEEVTPELLDEIEVLCRTKLADYPEFAARAFALPAGLRAFYIAAQNVLQPVRDEESFRFYACTWLPTDGLHLADEAQGDSTPWLEIGSFAENRWAFICCDTEDELFGSVVERQDSTPWSMTVYEDEVWIDMEDFLKGLYP